MVDLLCTVVSVVPFDLSEDKPGLIPGFYHIPASSGPPQVLHVGTAIHYVYLDDTRGHLQVRTPSNEVARSICEDYINSQLRRGPDARPGLFWVPGELSAQEVQVKFKGQLEEERRLQFNWFTEICKLADDDWQKYHSHTVICDFQRKAAQLLGWNPEQHEWMSANLMTQGTRCPSCNTSVILGTVVCGNCKCILDPEKYKTLQFA